MEDQQSPSLRAVLPISIILGLPGWIALIYLMTQTVPSLGNRWIFFASVVCALTGSSIPVVGYLNRVIKVLGPASFETVIRESTLIGLYAGILLWLNKGQVLSFGLALILAVGLLLVELLLRLRSRSEWHPE